MASQIEMLEYWDLGCKAIEKKDYPSAIQYFESIIQNSITPPANIYYNKSIVHFILGQFAEAISVLDQGLQKNEHMAIGYFQRGIVNIKLRNVDEALRDFNRTMDKMRGNLFIDYKQLGMNFKLSQIEIRINIAYCINEQGRGKLALSELQNAAELNIPIKNKVIEGRVERFKATGKVALLLLPTEALNFKPPQSKIVAKTEKDYLAKDKGKIYLEGDQRYTLDPLQSDSSVEAQSLVSKRPPKPSSPAPNLKNSSGPNRRPPPPSKKPPLPNKKPERPSLPPMRKQDSKASNLIVKVHYTFTIALYLDPHAAMLDTFKGEVARKFNIKPHTISLWYKSRTELVCIFDEPTLKHALSHPTNEYRVTMWAYDEKGIEGKDCIALYDFNPTEDCDLPFRAGDIISILNQINNHWLEGKLGENTGLFPRNYVKID
ncbi:NADPH oxidase activator 1 isoform X7 [Oopsacas minuta]|uniref:NADPH oxidase activator 1 isoform X7 n=1 Tax=Oopsacas minuta TaxID=111878 RepID=A0AAV7JUL7_9METZ|nr:NADPH oxidase activator 1 isoform X7 [Oopsacas minuta]